MKSRIYSPEGWEEVKSLLIESLNIRISESMANIGKKLSQAIKPDDYFMTSYQFDARCKRVLLNLLDLRKASPHGEDSYNLYFASPSYSWDLDEESFEQLSAACKSYFSS